MRFYKSILFFLFVALQVNSVAQTFPVSANLQLVPPYSVYLSDYTVGGNEQMKLNLFLRDLNEPSYAVKLFFVLEGAGIRIETNPNFAPPPIVLEGGVPQVLGADELGTYLDPRNLLFNGITRQQYEQRAALPEGFYKFSFRVLDYRRKDVQLSREATANAWFVLNDPPRLNTPVCGTTLPLRDPQNIFFQWLPMGAASPNSALTTEYEFTLVEIRPPGRNPNDAINVGLPLFQFTTQQTSLVYGILEPALIPGQEYAFRVRAKDTNGKDLFKNQGYSEVCTFKFGEVQAVPPPEGLNIYPESERRAKVTWYQMLEADRYRVEYRKKLTTPEEANRAWFTKETLEDNTVLNDLEAETEYELRVANVVKNINSRYTETKTFRTLPVRVFACGQQVDNITPANQKPLISPFIGQLWKIGQFEMEVMQVRGSNGTYSGLGAVIVPYLGFRVYGTFTDIKVNENREVIVGTVVGLSEGVEAFKKRFEKEVPQVQIGDPTATAGTNQPVLFDGVDEKTDKDLDSVYVDSKGTIVVVDSEGGQEEIKPTKGKGTRITDKNGDQWIVDKDGKVSKVPSTAISNAPPTTTLTSASQASYTIEFLANNSQRNGFDQKEDAYSLADYETIKIKGKDYIMAWKSVESGQQDWVNAKATGQASFPKAVGFKTSAGEATSQAANDAGQKQVTVMGRDDGQEEELTAYVKIKEPNKDEQVLELGKLSIKSYSKVRKKVIVVPVNDADVPDGLALAAELNRIYKQAVAEWDVTVAEPFTIDVKSIQGLDDGQSGIFSSFPPKMRDFKNAFKDARNVDGKAYYVFLVKGSGAQRAGFMPFKREFGFVFTDRAANQITTIAHELGHGAFRLRHTFSSDAFKATERTTTNLMDYNGGTTLKKYQWDFVHDPESMSGWLQDDEESALSADAAYLTFEQNLLAQVGDQYASSGCFSQAYARYKEVKERYESESIGFYAGTVKFWLCVTEKENCSADNQYGCGFTNGLLQELDWLTLVDAVSEFEITKADIERVLLCLVNDIPLGTHPSNPTFEDAVFKCFTGGPLTGLKDGINDFVKENWDEPYYQGQATVFALTLISPFKAGIVKKLEKLTKYSTRLSKLKALSRATQATELVDYSKALVKYGDEVTDITTSLIKTGDDFTIVTNARKLPGTAAGNGHVITGTWLRGTERNAGLFPKSVADKLKGKQFRNFDEFREAFWKEVANDPNLAGQFTSDNFYRMKAGAAPRAEFAQQIGGQQSYVLHHKTPINQGGAVYDIDNLYIVTPKYHKEILDPAFHYGYGY